MWIFSLSSCDFWFRIIDLRKPAFCIIFIRMLLVWDIMGEVMGVVWGVANFTALLFFSWGKPCKASVISHQVGA